MNQQSLGEQWQVLCDEHEAARTAYLKAFSTVNSKFASIGAGAWQINPSNEELSKFETTWKNWQEVKERMDSFVQAHA